MKKVILFLACILFTGMISGQTLSKGSILSIHIFSEYELLPGVTTEQFKDFILDKEALDEFNKFEGCKVLPILGLRGENEGKLGIMWYFESVDVGDKYWAEEGTLQDTEAGNTLGEVLGNWLQEAGKYLKIKDRYTDWEIK